MPAYTNPHELAEEVERCHEKLDELIADKILLLDKEATSFTSTEIQHLKDFYNISFRKASDAKKHTIVVEYQQLTSIFNDVLNGRANSKKALDLVNNLKSSRRNQVILANIIKICEFLFWATAAVACFAACSTVGLSLVLTNPIIGFMVILGIGAVMLKSLDKAKNCILHEFKPFDDVYQERRREKDLVSFFSPGDGATELEADPASNYAHNSL